jgi:mono/diheme cytochrome c family protein
MSSRSHGDLLKMFTPTIALALFAGAVAVAGQVPSPAPAGNVENGKKLFVKNGCAGCHGLEGQGAPTSGPRIGPNPLPVAAFIATSDSEEPDAAHTGRCAGPGTDRRACGRGEAGCSTVLSP